MLLRLIETLFDEGEHPEKVRSAYLKSKRIWENLIKGNSLDELSNFKFFEGIYFWSFKKNWYSFKSLIVAFTFEEFSLAAISSASWTILYGGLMSVGIAYTLQVIAQKKAHPSHAAIILSMEGLFAVLGGWLVLSEVLTWRIILGCCLMLAGMLISQLSKKHWNQT